MKRNVRVATRDTTAIWNIILCESNPIAVLMVPERPLKAESARVSGPRNQFTLCPAVCGQGRAAWLRECSATPYANMLHEVMSLARRGADGRLDTAPPDDESIRVAHMPTYQALQRRHVLGGRFGPSI